MEYYARAQNWDAAEAVFQTAWEEFRQALAEAGYTASALGDQLNANDYLETAPELVAPIQAVRESAIKQHYLYSDLSTLAKPLAQRLSTVSR